jgi:GntR family transcriptional regulator
MNTRAEQIAEHYRALIRDGQMPPGTRLPTIKDAAKELAAAPPTVRQAMSWLRVEGFITTTQQGSYVAERPTTGASAQDRLRRAVRIGTTFSEGETQQVTAAQLINPPMYVLEAYDLEPGAQVCRREYVIGTGTHRTLFGVDWYPAEFAARVPELLSTAPRRGGELLQQIQEAFGRTVTHGRDSVQARTADAREANHLGLPIGAPILAGAHAWSDDAGLIVYGEWCIPERITLGWGYDLDGDGTA